MAAGAAQSERGQMSPESVGPFPHDRDATNPPQAEARRSKLLLAEDDDCFAGTLAILLQGDGRFEIVGRARNGAEAVARVETLQPEVVLMDIEMPVMDGVEATRRILARSPSVRIIVVSGSNYSERALEARLAGAYDYVRKDRLTDELAEVIIAAAHLINRGDKGWEERGCGDTGGYGLAAKVVAARREGVRCGREHC
jgi:CheY-like chemotaxis protein